ncbi:VanZ like protein [Agromyces ramosus]|uniref:VanZ like protein n=1 Tax=Agromyces ramosus TaxID=33879 RepID=A0A4Q7MMR2_9MICO|nr:VanZ family protein [Agromyces ramosus]RZS68062.1 VanZ like protein [Agromyces ramosus]
MVAEASILANPKGRAWFAAGAVAYAAALAIVLLWPVHVDGEGGLFRFDPILNLLARFGIPIWASYPIVEFVGNAALFLPLGVLWALATDRWPAVLRILSAGVLATLISAGAETVQGRLLSDRTMDPRDILANAVGAAVGAFATVLAVRAARRRGESDRATSPDQRVGPTAGS